MIRVLAHAFLLLAALGTAPEGSETSREPAIADWQWVDSAAGDAWAAVAQGVIATEDPTESLDSTWRVVVEAGDGWGHTWAAVLKKDGHGSICGQYVELLGENLERQLLDLRMEDSVITVSDAVERIDLARGEGCAAGCDTLRLLGTRIEAIREPILPLPDRVCPHCDYFVIHADVHGVWSRKYHVFQDDGELATWCHDLLSAIKECKAPAP